MAQKTSNVLRLLSKQIFGSRSLSVSAPNAASKYHARMGAPVYQRYASLPLPASTVFLTYIWIDGSGERTRAKTRVVDKEMDRVEDIPSWHFDGSSTQQSTGEHSDMVLHPVFMTSDPFYGPKHRLVLCEVKDRNNDPAYRNYRSFAVDIVEKVKEHEPWFGMEQEYTIISGRTGRPVGWPMEGYPPQQGPYYCAQGAQRAFGRDIADAHTFACINAGLAHTGTNAEVMPGQWEYQVGPCLGIEMGDHLWMARYIMERVAEDFDADVTLDPKPVQGDWNGAGNHCNFSTKAMRAEGGIEVIKEAMPLLEEAHDKHIEVYDPHGGEDNKRRLTGRHETATIDQFSWGIGNRGTSIRVPRPCAESGKGWLEDRRPSANCDPYLVVGRLLKTVVLKDTS